RFYDNRADGLAEHPILTPRGVLVFVMPGQEHLLAEGLDDPAARRLDAAAAYEPAAMDIDVHALHAAYLRLLRRRGGRLLAGAPVRRLRSEAGVWTAATPRGDFAAPVVVNAAGAWADAVAALAALPRLGIVPKRRTALIVAAPP